MDVQSQYRAALRDSHSVSVVLGDPGVCPACILEFFIRFRCGWDVAPWRAIREMQEEYELIPLRSKGAFHVPAIRSEERNGIVRLRYDEARRIAQLYKNGVREFTQEHAPVTPVAAAPLQHHPPPETTAEIVVAETAVEAAPEPAPGEGEPPKAAPKSALLELARTDAAIAAVLDALGGDFFGSLFDDLWGGRRRKKPRKRPRT